MNNTTIPAACAIALVYIADLIRGREGEFVYNRNGLVAFIVSALEREYAEKGFVTITVHDGTFHCDELVMIVLFEYVTGLRCKVIRSRTEITSCINGDVGRGQFDHHGPLDDKIRCAASRIFCALYQTPEYHDRFPEEWWRKVAEIVDLVSHQDNTGEMNGLFPYVSTLSRHSSVTKTDNFGTALEMMRADLTAKLDLLLEEVKQFAEIEPLIDEQANEDVMVFDRNTTAVDVKQIIWERNLPVVFIVSPNGKDWSVFPAPEQTAEYKRNSSKKLFDSKFRGLDDAALAAVCGLDDAVFCHAKGFAAKFHSKESAVKFAKMNLN